MLLLNKLRECGWGRRALERCPDMFETDSAPDDIGLHYKVDIGDEEGEWLKCDSLLNGFLEIFHVQANQSQRSIIDSGGTTRTVAPGSINLAANASAGITAFGLVVGTSTAGVSILDTALGTQIVEGSGTSQLLHKTVAVEAASSDSNQAFLDISRQFENQSGGNIAVTEVGMYCQADDTGGTARNFAALRELASFTINDGLTGTLTIRLSTASVGLREYFRYLQTHISQISTTATNISGNSVAMLVNSDCGGGLNGAANATRGVTVGNAASPTTFVPTQNALSLRIVDGTSTDQLNHLVNVIGDITTQGSNLRFLATRSFQNGSGASITNGITEIGLIFANRFTGTGGSGADHFQMARNLPVAFAVTDEAIVVIEFQIQI